MASDSFSSPASCIEGVFVGAAEVSTAMPLLDGQAWALSCHPWFVPLTWWPLCHTAGLRQPSYPTDDTTTVQLPPVIHRPPITSPSPYHKNIQRGRETAVCWRVSLQEQQQETLLMSVYCPVPPCINIYMEVMLVSCDYLSPLYWLVRY